MPKDRLTLVRVHFGRPFAFIIWLSISDIFLLPATKTGFEELVNLDLDWL